jgi:hypothetical protein
LVFLAFSLFILGVEHLEGGGQHLSLRSEGASIKFFKFSPNIRVTLGEKISHKELLTICGFWVNVGVLLKSPG